MEKLNIIWNKNYIKQIIGKRLLPVLVIINMISRKKDSFRYGKKTMRIN